MLLQIGNVDRNIRLLSFRRPKKTVFETEPRKISVTSAVSDQSEFTSPIRRSNARVFEWILRQRVGKYGGRCVEERIGSFLVRKTQQASKGSLAMFL